MKKKKIKLGSNLFLLKKKEKRLGSNFRMRSIFLSNIQRELGFYLDIIEKQNFELLASLYLNTMVEWASIIGLNNLLFFVKTNTALYLFLKVAP